MRTPAILGLDVGGANLKAYHTRGVVRSQPFPLWQKPDELTGALASLIADLPPAAVVALTMTGELCDCFESKRQGVAAIVKAVETSTAGRSLRVWQNDGRFVESATALATPLKTAAANWLALATLAARLVPAGPGLLLDAGSTTTDIIPLLNGHPVPQARTDPERLKTSELVYTGVRRTPVCALLGDKVMAELFATTLDVYLQLGLIDEQADDHKTADQRPATRAFAEVRLARMLGADLDTSTPDERRRLAQDALARQVELIADAIRRVSAGLPGGPRTVVLSGEGEFLLRHVLNQQPRSEAGRIVSLAEEYGPAISQAACAFAVAVLASEEEA